MKLTENKATLTELCRERNFERGFAVLIEAAPKFINTCEKKEFDESYQPSEHMTSIGKLTGVFFMLLRFFDIISLINQSSRTNGVSCFFF